MNYLFAEINYSVAEMKYSGPEMIVRDAEIFSAFGAENFFFEEFCHRERVFGDERKDLCHREHRGDEGRRGTRD
ncbi:MAG: hypothetical protein KF831_07465 [Acidobacteria bacterium]|nr:hypothetical protein [Acidobacteriota bacterium]